jgi:hypothetical protein
MLGLDTGWNCHISLGTDDFTSPNISKQHHPWHPNPEEEPATTAAEVSELTEAARRAQQRRSAARKTSLTTKSLPGGLKMRLLSSSKSAMAAAKSRATSADKNHSSSTQIVKFDLTNLRRKSSSAETSGPSASKQAPSKMHRWAAFPTSPSRAHFQPPLRP